MMEMDEMDEEGRTRHHARTCAAPLPLPPHPTAAVSRNEEAGLNRQPAPLAWARAYAFSVQQTGFISQSGARVQAEKRARARPSEGSDARQSGKCPNEKSMAGEINRRSACHSLRAYRCTRGLPQNINSDITHEK